ncbi:MAG: NADH-quinone oxidoreductase subunit B family protein [Candidatus Aquicultorales bacterium]
MSNAIRLSTAWLKSCSGCHMSMLDLHEAALDILSEVRIVYSPLVDARSVPEADIALVEGAVGSLEDERILTELRAKSKILVALGTCACFGGIPGMRNLYTLESVLRRSYVEAESMAEPGIPSEVGEAALLPRVRALSHVIPVDYSIPGCPPIPSMILEALRALAAGNEPQLPKHNLCHECEREHDDMLIPQRGFLTDSVKALMELAEIDESKCFLEQGVPCLGPATREGCHTRCLKGNVPCRGCMGPTPGALEQGAKIINALASILPAGGLMLGEDIVGLGYRYSTAVSIYPSLREVVGDEGDT